MEKVLKADKIGSVHKVKFNNMKFTVTISADPSQYKFYSDLGLDVFEFVEKANVEVKKIVDDSPRKSNGKRKRKDSTNG